MARRAELERRRLPGVEAPHALGRVAGDDGRRQLPLVEALAPWRLGVCVGEACGGGVFARGGRARSSTRRSVAISYVRKNQSGASERDAPWLLERLPLLKAWLACCEVVCANKSSCC